jgi:dihydrofolate synthase/folylpolyglutamate synthase
MAFTTIAEAIAYIEGVPEQPAAHVPLDQRQAARFGEMPPLLAALGDPQARLRAVHVTGTSGKGSTATMVAAVARAAGRRVGLYTNPYVVASQERVQIDGAFIDDASFIAGANAVAEAAAQIPGWQPHVKQKWVALALHIFAQARVDLAVVEVGMGGRFDETNVVRPAAAIITNIGFDHMEFLGPTLPQIAWHKAGIIKPGALVVTGATQPDVLAVIQREADAVGAPLLILGADMSVGDIQFDRGATRFTYHDDQGTLADLRVPLPGEYQARNATLAIRAARHVLPDLAPATIRAGLASAWLPGRFEIVAERPTVVLDVAHNPDKIRALVATLQATLRGRRVWVVFGALEAKEIAPMLAALAPLQPHLIATTPVIAVRRTLSPDQVAAVARTQGISAVDVEPDPQRAIDRALAQAGADDVVVVTGSLYLVSALRGRWR